MLEVGCYIRQKDGIHKIYAINDKKSKWKYLIDKDEDGWCRQTCDENITEHSKNVTELIKAGDIVKYKARGMRLTNIAVVESYKDARNGREYLLVGRYSLEQVKILEILTKEQYKTNCYKVEEY